VAPTTSRFLSPIVALLKGVDVQKISFIGEAVSITPQGYMQVADALADGTIRIVERTTLPHDFSAGYVPKHNLLLIKPGLDLTTVRVRGLIVHEMTHAQIDLMGLPVSRGLHRTEGEGLSYIAQVLYIFNSDGDTRNTPNNFRFFRVAEAIRQKITASRRSPYIVSGDDMRELRNAVGQDPHYLHIRGMLAESDG
jgi:hypothetical protein